MGQQHDCRWLWEPLSELVAERRTGTLYIKSDDAHAGMVLLSEGEIVSFMYQSKFGAPAVELIQQVSGGTFRFDATGRGLKGGECPPTGEILHALAPRGQNAVSGSVEAARHVHDKATLRDFLGDLSQQLQSYIGPIATVVVKDAVAELGPIQRVDQAEALISRLMRDIDDQGDASSFLSAALKSLSKVQGNVH
jgi:hypothetical protein